MKELDSFTVERLEEILNFDLPRHPAALAEIVALARIALAAKRAEPFAWKWRGAVGDIWTQEKRKADFVKENCPELPVTELYTTPQLNSPEIPDERLIALANHIQSSLGGLPDEWQSWADEIVSDLRKYAAPEKENG
ncbi:hypothetical protein ACSMDG_09150 [Yersinia proxima]